MYALNVTVRYLSKDLNVFRLVDTIQKNVAQALNCQYYPSSTLGIKKFYKMLSE